MPVSVSARMMFVITTSLSDSVSRQSRCPQSGTLAETKSTLESGKNTMWRK
jgi:hypothetical protein